MLRETALRRSIRGCILYWPWAYSWRLSCRLCQAQAFPAANLPGPPLRSGRFGVYAHSGATGIRMCNGRGRAMVGRRAVWLLEETRRHLGRKSRDFGEKRCRLFAALAGGVGDKVAGRCDGGGDSADRIKRHVYRQGGVMIFFRFCCIPFGPYGLFPFSQFVQTPCASLFP